MSFFKGCFLGFCVLASPLVLTSCAVTPAPQVHCDGQPNWCVVASNEMNDDATLYIDGQVAADVPGQQTVKIPVLAGTTHEVNDCMTVVINPGQGLLQIGRQTQNECTKPKSITFSGNYRDIIYTPSPGGS